MQTFLPYSNYFKTALVLDKRRLGNQRCETYDIYRINIFICTGEDLFDSEKQKNYLLKRYRNHPIVKMWRGYDCALLEYGIVICNAWKRQGCIDNMKPKFLARISKTFDCQFPKWLGDERIHASHRSNLLRKFPEWYSQFNWKEDPDLPYVWATKGGVKCSLR